MALDEITVEELTRNSSVRAEDMDLRHKECNGKIDLKAIEDKNGPYWLLKCSLCHQKTLVHIGEDTKAIAITANDGKTRTLSTGQTVEQRRRQHVFGGG
jgi:hypothetical protein